MGLWQTLKKVATDISVDSKTGEVSPQKLAVSTAYFLGSVCFMWFHYWLFAQETDIAKVSVGLGQMPILWLVYFGIIGGHHVLLEKLPLKSTKDES